MARIQAGSTLVNQYAPPFVVSSNVAQGWKLCWNETLKAFEAIDPDANVIEAGFDVIEVYERQNVTQQRFTVPWLAASKASLIISIDGVKQQQNAYTIIADEVSNTTVVTLAEEVSNETVEILGLQTSGGATINVFGPQNIDSNLPGTVNSYFDLSWFAATPESLIVTIDGVKQHVTNYNVEPTPGSNFTGTRLTFPDRYITFDTDGSGIDAGADIITTNEIHGFDTGAGVYYGTDGGVATIGLTNNALYYVRRISAFQLALYATRQNALDDASRLPLNISGAETHTLTLIADPYLYINVNTISVANGGSGYSVSDILTVNGGSPVVEAQIRVDAVDSEAQFTFDTDGSGNIAAPLTIVSGGSGYPAAGGGTFNITVASDAGFVAGTEAIVTYTTDGTGTIDSAVVTTPGAGYTPSLTGAAVNTADIPDPTLGAITGFTVLFSGEYVAFPSSPATTSGPGAGATFNISKVAPSIEVIGISTTGETPASPVNVTNLGSPNNSTVFGLFDSKSVTGDTQVFSFKSISEGSGITLALAGDTVQISSTAATFTTTGGGTSILDDAATTDPLKVRNIRGGERIALSVENASPNQNILVDYDFAYTSTSAATVNVTTQRLLNLLPPGGGVVVTLPLANVFAPGDTITIKDANGTAGTNNISINTVSNETIDGVDRTATSLDLTTNRAYITLYSDGASGWHIIAQG